MLYVKPGGGLGNKMFTVASVYSYTLNKKYKLTVLSKFHWHDDPKDLTLCQVFPNLNIDNVKCLVKWEKTWSRIYRQNYENRKYNKINAGEGSLVDGLFQSSKYFHKRRKDILKLFQFSKKVTEPAQSFYNKHMKDKKTVSLHVRFGDNVRHLKEGKYIMFMLSKEYYYKAIDKLKKKCQIVIFSDNAWDFIKAEIIPYILKKKHSYVLSKGTSQYVDMYLMSKCEHNIISNSTFAWWGAYLNQNPKKKVVSPKEFLHPKFKYPHIKETIYLKEWRKIKDPNPILENKDLIRLNK
jgi:hypothetical protein